MTDTLEWQTGDVDDDSPELSTSELFQPVEDDDVIVTPTDEPTQERRKGTCEVCGNKAWDGRSYRCEAHRNETVIRTSSLRPPRNKKSGPLPGGLNAKDVQKAILSFNPQIVQAGQWITGVPTEWLDPRDARGNPVPVASVQIGVNEDGTPKVAHFWQPCLSDQFALTEKQAELIATGLVQFCESQTGKKILLMGSVAAPYAAIAAAGGVVIMHVIKLSNVKAQVMQLKSALEDAKKAGSIQTAPVPSPDEVYLEDAS